MSTPPLIRHGQYANLYYPMVPGFNESWAGKSTPEERPDGDTSGIVKRYSKNTKARDTVMTAGLISKASADAIQYTSPAELGLRGLGMIAGLFALGVIPISVPHTWSWIVWGDWFGIVLGSFSTVSFILAFSTIFLWTVRLELFQPIDQPTIFDRKHRKVYRIFSESKPGWKGLFKPWPMRACEYDWDLIDAEHNATIATTGSTIRREHSLVFLVRRSADDSAIIDSFGIGNSLFVIDDAVDAAWEHIRRFMEENGPPLPEGETLPQPGPRKGLGARVRDVTPLGKPYWEWWREQFPLMLLAHALLPLTVVFIGLWVFFGWLAVKTSKSIEWPPEVVAAVGADVAAPTSTL